MSSPPPSPGPGPVPPDPGALVAALFTQSPLSVALYDAAGRVAAGNAAYERHFGLRVADVPPDWSLFTDAQLAAAGVLPLIQRAFAGEAVTLPAVRYDAAAATGGPGRAVWTEGHCYPVRDGSGRVTYVAVVHVDVTAWAEAEGARVEAAARVEAEAAERAAVLGQLAEGVIVADPAGRLTFVNEAAARLHGVARLDVPPEAYAATYHLFTEDGRPYPSADLPLARAVRHGETVLDARWRIRRPDGTEVLAVGSARPVRGPDGARLGAVLTVRDDTVRAAAAADLTAANARLREQAAALEAQAAALRHSQERYALAARATSNAIWDWDLTTDAMAWNEGLHTQFGHPPGAVPDGATPDGFRFWVDHLHPDDRERVIAGVHRVIADPAGGSAWSDAYRFRRGDGSYAHVLDRGYVARQEAPGAAGTGAAGTGAAGAGAAGGRASRMIGAMEDVTARRAAEAALAEQTRLLRTVAENATLALFVMDERQRCTYLNPAAERLTGFRLEQLQGNALHDYVHHTRPDGTPYPLAECPIDQAFPQNMREQGTEVFVHKDGTFYPVAFTASPIRDEQTGAPVGTIIEVRDVRAERAAAAERERLLAEAEAARAVAEAAAARTAALQAATAALAEATSFEDLARVIRGTAAATLDAAAALVYRVGEPRLGEDPGSLYPALLEDAGGFGADVPERWRVVALTDDAGVSEVVRTGAPVFHATPAERADTYPHLMAHSTSAPFASWAFLPLLVEGRPVGSLALAWRAAQPGGAFDESDRALATVLAAQCAVSLARVRLYAAERFARARAEAAQAEAEAANRAKGEFLAVMSHELRTPLNAIGGYAELLEMGIHGSVTAEQRTALDRIQRSQRVLLSRINEVLNYARLETGAVMYDLTDVPVAEAVGAAEVLVAPQVRAKGLVFAWAGCDSTFAVRADRDKLQQILLNLLSNAIKFTEPRGGEPGRVEVSGGAAAGGMLAIRVRDTGIGIPADKLASVFEPFVQVDQRLTRPHEGSGLGLAISRDLARGMGGDLTAESDVGVGSTFTLVLPAAGTPSA